MGIIFKEIRPLISIFFVKVNDWNDSNLDSSKIVIRYSVYGQAKVGTSITKKFV